MKAIRLTSSAPTVDLSELPSLDAQVECEPCAEEGTNEPAIAWVRARCHSCGNEHPATLGARCMQVVLAAIAENDVLDCQRCAALIPFAQNTRIVYL